MSKHVYITKTAGFLPNEPVINDEMEDYLGFIYNKASRSKNIVLRKNGIKQRYYAITKDGKATHSNADLTANAIRSLLNNTDKKIDLLTCGTATPDQMLPSHAVMVHGCIPELGPIEVTSLSGVCCSGMHAFKYAYMAVKTEQALNAISTGSERISRMLRSETYSEEVNNLAALQQNPYIAFDKDFLRWMLSDGAGAFLLSSEPAETGLSLRVDWLEGFSYAHMVETCMYMGGEKTESGSLQSYMDFEPGEILSRSLLSVKQDTKLLSRNIISLGFTSLAEVMDKYGVKVSDIDYFLPHISSEFFRDKIAESLKENDMEIPQEKWFTNLKEVGNVGSASIYLMVDGLLNSGRLKKGEKILLCIPESSRFSYVFCLLTVV